MMNYNIDKLEFFKEVSALKKFNRLRKEKGAITILTAVLLTALIGFTALTIDVGLHYYCGAKLQNAVDAAATAVAANLGTTENSLEDVAYSYLKKNGYDVDGKYKDNLKLKIEQKGTLAAATVNEDDYITTGYYKLTVELDDSTSFSNVLGISSLHLKKTACVRCEANYIEMPKALKYTVFAGSAKGTQQNPAVKINGRTGSTINEITASFEGLINGINSKIVQPIIGIFGGNPDYNDLVHINLSEVVTNGDVHSNSNISIGVQALNTSRLKDRDFNGEDNSEGAANDEVTEDEDVEPDDYGQVTYTAVTDIMFNNSLKTNRDESTHVYVQNQQYIEQTQAALNVLDKLENFDEITNTATLKSAYINAANEYFEEKTDVLLTQSQKEAILAQADNLVYNGDGSFTLNNQSLITYNVSQGSAEEYLAQARELGIDGLVAQLQSAGADRLYNSNNTGLLFQNVADKSNDFNYGIQFTRKNNDGEITTTKSLVVNGTQVNRNTTNIYNGTQGVTMNSATEVGARFAVARTFLQDSDYISVPNMKPYFVREVNKSIRKATQTREELGDSEVLGDRTVKEAVKNMGKDLDAFLKTESYTDNKYENNDLLTSADTSPLFTANKASASSGLTKLTGEDHTTYKGYALYDSNNKLKAPSAFIDEFRVKAFGVDGVGGEYGAAAVKNFYNEKIANNSSTKDKYATNYSADAVQAKRDSLTKTLGNAYGDKKVSVYSSELLYESGLPSLPDRADVFLGPVMSDFIIGGSSDTAYEPRKYFNSQMQYSVSAVTNESVYVTMPTYTSTDSNTISVTMSGSATWADGTSGAKSFSKMSSRPKPNMSNGGYYNGSFTHNGANNINLQSGGTYVNIGDVTVDKDWLGKGGGFDVGNSGGSNATVVIYGSLSTKTDINVRTNCILYVTGNISCNSSIYVEAGGKIYCSGTISAGENVYARTNSVVCAGSISCSSLVAEAGSSVYCSNTINASGTSDLYDNVKVCTNSNYTTANINLRNNTVVSCNGTFKVSNTSYTDVETSVIKAISVSFTAGNKNNITIKGTLMSTGDMYISPRVFLNGTIKCKGNLTLNGDKDWNSLNSYGRLYVTGNLLSNYTLELLNSEFYVCGNVDGANNAEDKKEAYNIFLIKGNDRVYIGGHVGTNSAKERHIQIESNSGCVFSVYGYDKEATTITRNPFKNVKEFSNKQTGSTVYIGDARLIDSSITYVPEVSFTNNFENFGSLYCYSKLTLSANAIFDGNGNSVFAKAFTCTGTTYVKNGHTLCFDDTASLGGLEASVSSRVVFDSTLAASGNIAVKESSRVLAKKDTSVSGTISTTDTSSFVCKGNLTAGGISASGSSKIWGLKNVQSSNVQIESDSNDRSEVFVGEATYIQSGATLVINGNFYSKTQILNGKNEYILSTLEIKQYGYFDCPEDITVTKSLTVYDGGVLYADGKVTLNGAILQNNHHMYIMQGLKIAENASNINKCELGFAADSDTFIGTNTPNSIGTITLNGYYFGGGNVYIENNLIINGYNKAGDKDKNYVYNRGESIIVNSGNTYVSGDITCASEGNGIYIEADTTMSCQSLTATSSIYNLGGLVVLKDLTLVQGAFYTDKGDSNYERGYSILNGGKNRIASAFMYIGGTKNITMGGIFENWAKFYSNAPITVNGYYIVEKSLWFGGTRYTRTESKYPDFAPHFSITNGNNCQIHCSGDISTYCGIYNYPYSSLSSGGDVKYGMAILNGGDFLAAGEVGYSSNAYAYNHIEVFQTGDIKKGSYSIVNGFVDNVGDDGYNKNSIFFAGGKLTLGTKEHYSSSEENQVGGTFQNWGTAYIDGALNVYSNKKYAYNISSILAQPSSNTFIDGDCFSSSVTAIMDNSIFMCSGDLQSKRAAKINIDSEFLTDGDQYTPCYVYIGGNFFANSSGLSSDSSTNTNTTRKLDIYSNSNIYVGGSLFANCELNIKQNVNLIVAGHKTLTSTESLSNIIDSIETGPLSKVTIATLIRDTDYRLFGYQHLNVDPCSRLIVVGNAFIRDTAKIRDMTKTYIYGDFTCYDYVEIGKALDGADETEAKEDLFKEEGETDAKYKFSNAASMYVGGDFYCSGYNMIYASSTLRVRDDYVSNRYLTLKHDAKIVVGKKLKAGSSIDMGSYSTAFVGGSMQAVTSTIKIRDCTNVFVGGNMTALSYIELGKAGDFVRENVGDSEVEEGEDNNYGDGHEKTHNQVACPKCSTTVKYNNATVTYIKCDNEDCGKYIKATVKCASCGASNYYAGANFACQNCGEHSYYQPTDSFTCPDCSTVNPIVIDASDPDNIIYRPFYIKCSNANCGVTFDPYAEGGEVKEDSSGTDENAEDTAAELANDSTDTAKGGTFYIGKKLVSYTGYIKEFAYSRVAVGQYVFTPKYVTLRHNADLWVMPETFNNTTYQKKAYVSQSDGSLWGDVMDTLKKLAHKITETFSPHAGSIYTLGELTLNKNASLMGTYDCIILGQCVLRQDSLVYMGHNFECSAPNVNLSLDSIWGNTSIVGFDTFGTANAKGQTFPVVVYADNEINIVTTVDMKLTYLVANKGDVNLYDIYSKSDNAERNAKQLPNAVCSYQGNINYFAMYGKIGALFYAPSKTVNLDGYYMEIWGSCIGDRVEMNTYYLALHRFTNWRTMNLHIAESGSVYLVSENEYDNAKDNIDDIYMFNPTKETDTSLPDGAQIFY